MDAGDWIAVYGAVLATALAYAQWRRDRGRFAVQPETLRVTVMGDVRTFHFAQVVNTGTRHLYLADMGLMKKDGTSLSVALTDEHYPIRIEEGQKHQSLAIESEQHPKDILYIWARDTTGKEYRSGSFPFRAGS